MAKSYRYKTQGNNDLDWWRMIPYVLAMGWEKWRERKKNH